MAMSYTPRNHHDDCGPSNHSGTAEILEVTQLLEAADIPCCIEWDVCVPDEQLDAACHLFETAPLNTRFERVASPDPYLLSLRYRFPTFKLKGVIFYFVLAPSSDCFCDPRPQFCERSHMGLPYPKDVYFARSLLVLQNDPDLADFVDAHNSTMEWGENNLNFPELQAQGVEYAFPYSLNVNRDFAVMWRRVVEGKEGRIEPLK
ncbi:hypothetical protein QBC33DRAFT_575286 [Phialemonium atrogriseum]|uniref:Uncharacterized protein n=1 Tax=Phialemonium atrogriseum TaxID=1093897 RepID=A0AAJ0C9Y4_9PEZI|nr:uncharacterized protein QBC33DRAFT_575286 [Phialemonium atrogriseum]KAK1772854.1 hypothetical protein QBC33DRAFT_575286 [Phialemonium atrogriseum]